MSLKRLEIWWRAFRFHYTSASFMPGILGAMIAWTTDSQFHPGLFLLVMLGLILNHMALNMTDDYYDFRHLVDAFAEEDKNPYAGGSGTLSDGLIQPRRMRQVFSTFYIIAIGIGLYLGMVRGFFVVLLWHLGFSVRFFILRHPSDLATEVLARWPNFSASVRESDWVLITSRLKGFPGRPSGERFLLESCSSR